MPSRSALRLSPPKRYSRAEIDARVDGILKGLARRLERDRRARSRRTAHAEARHASGERPTRKAWEDTARARPEDVLFDERHGTLVVPGERGRTHFYTPEGRLVSSVRYSREAIERKLKSGLWQSAGPETAQTLLAKLAERASEEP